MSFILLGALNDGSRVIVSPDEQQSFFEAIVNAARAEGLDIHLAICNAARAERLDIHLR